MRDLTNSPNDVYISSKSCFSFAAEPVLPETRNVRVRVRDTGTRYASYLGTGYVKGSLLNKFL